MPSGITNLAQLQTFGIAALYRGLQLGGNLRRYCTNYNAYRTPARRQPVRVPYSAGQAPVGLVNPEDGLPRNPASLSHVVIPWKAGVDATDTSHPIAFTYDRWELQESGLAVETVNDHAMRQVARYDQTFDNDVIAEMKSATAWGLNANRANVAIASAGSPTSAEVESLVQAALAIPWTYWRRGMVRQPGGDMSDGSPQRQIVCVLNVAVMSAIINEYFDDVAIGAYATNSMTWLQSTLGPMLGGMTLAVSHGMDDGITSAGDEIAFGTFLAGSIGYVDNDSPRIDANGYTAAGLPTLEQHIGFWRDHGHKHLAANECYAVGMTVA